MGLEEYVKQTLLDITNAVAAAQEQSKLHIAPGFVDHVKQSDPQFVKFDINVIVNKETGGALKVWSLGDAKAGLSSEKHNRISFEVPVYLQAPTEMNDRHFSKQRIAETE